MRGVLPPTVRTQSVRRALVVRVACVFVALGSLGGMVLGGAFSSTAAADANSSLTVSWAGDTSTASSIQPARDPNGFEYNEFKDIKVKVDQTQNIIDQAVRIDVSGFQGGTQQATDGTGQTWSTAMNFMQAMQCWGDPASATFAQTCQWGGRFVKNNGLGFSVYGDNVYRVAARDVSPTAANPVDVPFVTRDGESFTGRQVLDPSSGGKNYPILDEFNSDSSNELQGARINNDGTASFDFELQSDIQAPQLGCGRNAADQQCYLVLVPRGTVFGAKANGATGDCSSIFGAHGVKYAYGTTPAIQAGSPLNPGCGYWSNRIVVPMKFNQVAGACPSGAEERVIGSQLVISAMSSWQPKLCTAGGATFSFSTNPDSVARAQLLEKKADLAFTSYPIVKDQLDDSDQAAFSTTAVSYAPVAVGATTVSFLADGSSGQISSMVLSPRLLAKLLTQSYLFELPSSGEDGGNDDYNQLAPTNLSYVYLSQDPDFQALNPNWAQFISNPSIVLPGPADGDALAQVWKWIQSDADARDFLNGKEDSWHMKINPYYLPVGSPDAHVPAYDVTTGARLPNDVPVGLHNLDGSPQSLATAPIGYFLKEDASAVPHKLGVETSRFDSIQASPYVDDFVKAAVVTFRANPGAKTGWDPTAIKTDGTFGDWVSGGPQVPGQRFVISITDAAATARYDLTPAGLRAANGTAVSRPDPTSMAAAVTSGLVATSVAAVKQVDPAKVSASSYPLTTVVYAAVNLTASTSAARGVISKMIKYVAGDGQTLGAEVGQLPVGYLPLTGDLQSQATAAATAIASYTPSASDSSETFVTGNNTGTSSSSYDDGGATSTGAGDAATSGPKVTATGDQSVKGLTPASSTFPLGEIFLAVALGVGLVGAIFSPLVIRGLGRS